MEVEIKDGFWVDTLGEVVVGYKIRGVFKRGDLQLFEGGERNKCEGAAEDRGVE